MDAVATIDRGLNAQLAAPRARIGLIIPSVNTLSEPQFNHLLQRASAYTWRGPRGRRMEAAAAADARGDRDLGQAPVGLLPRPHRVPLHRQSMTQGPDGEGRILEIVREETGIDALATSRLVVDALHALGMKNCCCSAPIRATRTSSATCAPPASTSCTTWRCASKPPSSAR